MVKKSGKLLKIVKLQNIYLKLVNKLNLPKIGTFTNFAKIY